MFNYLKCCVTFFLLLSSSLTPVLGINPFQGRNFYVNPTFQTNIDSAIKVTTDNQTLTNLKIARNVPSAFWLDVKSKVQVDGVGLNTLAGILKDASLQSTPPLCVFIVYDLPSRDCSASASAGEICCAKNADGSCNYLVTDCTAGLAEYQHSYIDPIVTLLKKYSQVPVVMVIEPDSLGNLVTNMGNPRCSSDGTQSAYKNGIKYAVNQIATAPNVAIYLDSAWSGWLGWQNNAQGFQTLVNSLGIMSKMRGFATNVANYNSIGQACPSANWCLPSANHASDSCCSDPCKMMTQWNGCTNELNYVLLLQSLFPSAYFIIDSGRNAVGNGRTNCANWCNIANAGMGVLPTTKTASPLVDAYYWLKTPGESDGTSSSQSKRYDHMCSSSDSMQNMPEAGIFSIPAIQTLAKNANFGSSPAVSPVPTPIPSPTPSPIPSPTPSPTVNPIPSVSPTPAPAVNPIPSVSPTPSVPNPVPSKNCGLEWQQCGGIGFMGPKCCASGLICKYNSDYYSQCVKGTTPATPASAIPTHSQPTNSTGYWKCYTCEFL
jgi:cellulose 1,4-beta-cellobiosidase